MRRPRQPSIRRPPQRSIRACGRPRARWSRLNAPWRSVLQQKSPGSRSSRGLLVQCVWRDALRSFGDVGGLQALRALGDLELDLLTLFERPESLTRDRRVVHKHVLAVLLADEAEALFGVEPLHMSDCHKSPLLSSVRLVIEGR